MFLSGPLASKDAVGFASFLTSGWAATPGMAEQHVRVSLQHASVLGNTQERMSPTADGRLQARSAKAVRMCRSVSRVCLPLPHALQAMRLAVCSVLSKVCVLCRCGCSAPQSRQR